MGGKNNSKRERERQQSGQPKTRDHNWNYQGSPWGHCKDHDDTHAHYHYYDHDTDSSCSHEPTIMDLLWAMASGWFLLDTSGFFRFLCVSTYCSLTLAWQLSVRLILAAVLVVLLSGLLGITAGILSTVFASGFTIGVVLMSYIF